MCAKLLKYYTKDILTHHRQKPVVLCYLSVGAMKNCQLTFLPFSNAKSRQPEKIGGLPPV
jgi:hypothetical protein